jgi:hypothetical protein
VKITGMMTDHAADQKKLRALFLAMKQCMDCEIGGEHALLSLMVPQFLDTKLPMTKLGPLW